MGDTVRFQTPDGAVVRVTVDGYADPGDAPSGATADPGERLVTLELSVTPEGAEGTAAVPLPFEKADSFILIAEDDTLTVAQLGGDELLGATLPPGETVSTTLAFSVGAASADPLRVHAGGGVAAAIGHLGPEQVRAAAGPVPDRPPVSGRPPAGSTPRRPGSRAPRSTASAGSARRCRPAP